jgi:hypothetical protein
VWVAATAPGAAKQAISGEERSMKRIVALALAIWLAPAGIAHAQSSACRAEARARHLTGAARKAFVARCEKALAACESSARSRSSRQRMSPADEARLDRAMRRNILQSIEQELRSKRVDK